MRCAGVDALRRDTCRGRRSSRSRHAARPSTSVDRALGHDEGAADRIAHHLHAARGRAARRAAAPAASGPRRRRPRAARTRAATNDDQDDEQQDDAQHHAPGFCAGAAAGMRRAAGCRARAWPPALRGCPARAAMTCCHACVAPVEILLAERLARCRCSAASWRASDRS